MKLVFIIRYDFVDSVNMSFYHILSICLHLLQLLFCFALLCCEDLAGHNWLSFCSMLQSQNLRPGRMRRLWICSDIEQLKQTPLSVPTVFQVDQGGEKKHTRHTQHDRIITQDVISDTPNNQAISDSDCKRDWGRRGHLNLPRLLVCVYPLFRKCTHLHLAFRQPFF